MFQECLTNKEQTDDQDDQGDNEEREIKIKQRGKDQKRARKASFNFL